MQVAHNDTGRPSETNRRTVSSVNLVHLIRMEKSAAGHMHVKRFPYVRANVEGAEYDPCTVGTFSKRVWYTYIAQNKAKT